MAVAVSNPPIILYSSSCDKYYPMEVAQQQFGRYQGDRNNVNAIDRNTFSLEEIAVILGDTPDFSSPDFSPPLRRGRSPVASSRKTQSFPAITRGTARPCLHTNNSRPPLVKSRSVRFADTQGLPLEAVRSLTSADPFETEGEIVPSLIQDLGSLTPLAAPSTRSIIRKITFSQPSLQPNFHNRVETLNVALENVSIDSRCINGTVCVRNLCYEKTVYVRWTTDKWATQHDTICTYCNGTNDHTIDRFSFSLPLNNSRLELAICFKAVNGEYWDNNDSLNYVISANY
jgi:protein phosphatase 1 regulatory subunit 3A/B/C/D/E